MFEIIEIKNHHIVDKIVKLIKKYLDNFKKVVRRL